MFKIVLGKARLVTDFLLFGICSKSISLNRLAAICTVVTCLLPMEVHAAGRWFLNPPASDIGPRWLHTAVWTGTEMITFGGAGCCTALGNGARFSPAANAWTVLPSLNAPPPKSHHVSVWTGTEMLVYGGLGSRTAGGRYAPSSNEWRPISTIGAPHGGRSETFAIWTGTEMIVWGGPSDFALSTEGGRYNPSTDSWTSMSTLNAPAARSWPTAVWTGTEAIYWGGVIGGVVNSGGRYNPTTDTWWPTSMAGAPSPRWGHLAVWTGSEMIIWSGSGTSTGALYNPATDTWRPMSDLNAPPGRQFGTAVWTGTEMIVFGGGPGNLKSGGRYNPTTDTWVLLEDAQLQGRAGHTAVWTGTSMLVFGGGEPTTDTIYTYVPTGAPPNTPPSVTAFAPLVVSARNAISIPFEVSDSDTAASLLSVTASSSDTALVATPTIAGSGSSRILNLTPTLVLTRTGTVTISVQATDFDGATSTRSFLVTLVAVPLISGIPTDKQLAKNSAPTTISFTVSDVDTPASDLIVTAVAGDPLLFPFAHLVLGGTGGARTLTLHPALGRTGTTTIQIGVSDGAATGLHTLSVSVTNSPPIIEPDLMVIPEGGSTSILSNGAPSVLFNDTDPDGDTLAASVVGPPAHGALVLNSDGTFTYTHDGSLSTSDLFTYRVSDGSALSPTVIVAITIMPHNDSPVIVLPPIFKTLLEPNEVPVYNLEFRDEETSAAGLSITLGSSNLDLLPLSGLVLAGGGTNRTLTLTPNSGRFGTSIITITASDGVNDTVVTKTIQVDAAPNPPVISDVLMREDEVKVVSFTVSDPDGPADSILPVRLDIPGAGLIESFEFGGAGADRTLTLRPIANVTGSREAFLVVQDEFFVQSSSRLLITVEPVNDPPVITVRTNGTILLAEDSEQTVFHFEIDDVDSARSAIAVSVSSDNLELFPIGSLIPQYVAGSLYAVRLNPAKGVTGSCNLLITAHDGEAGTPKAWPVEVRRARMLQLGHATAVRGGILSIPINMIPLGDEAYWAFSLQFDHTSLDFKRIDLAPDHSGGVVSLNLSQLSAGKVGVNISKPGGGTFGSLKSVLASAVFDIAPHDSTNRVTFSGSPTALETSNAGASPLPTNYEARNYVTQPGYEADVSPRTGGSNTGTITVGDWVLMGRFVAGLETPDNEAEFQRIDCAPRTESDGITLKLGNGSISIVDWVQAGRYAAGLDPVPLSGGPTSSPSSPFKPAAFQRVGLVSSVEPVREVALHWSTASARRLLGTVVLNAMGDECALGFSLKFDPSRLQFRGASAASGEGPDADPQLVQNSADATAGILGLALAMRPGQSYHPGPRRLMTIEFERTDSSISDPVLPATFDPTGPVILELSNVVGDSVPVRWTVAATSLPIAKPPLRLKIEPAGKDLILSWPKTLSSLILESTGDIGASKWQPVVAVVDESGDEYRVSLIPTAANHWYRLRSLD